jgi:hypothetical protein
MALCLRRGKLHSEEGLQKLTVVHSQCMLGNSIDESVYKPSEKHIIARFYVCHKF